MVDGATTAGEATAARKAMERHVAKHGAPPPRPEPVRRVSEPIPGTMWLRLRPPLSPSLWPAIAPDSHRVLMECITTRQPHRCSGCLLQYEKRARMWRPIAYNGNHRSARFCVPCFAPDPKAPTMIGAAQETTA